MSAPPFSIGSDLWPGLSKVAEECGEVIQVIGKLLATGGEPEHWDGSNLADRFASELADLRAAIEFVIWHNERIDVERFQGAADIKYALFVKWHAEQSTSAP